MSVSLQKGQKVSLTKDRAGLNQVLIGLGWDQAEQSKGFFAKKQTDIDCDASVFMLKGGRLSSKEDIVYFGNLRHYTNAVMHMGDNLTGAGEGDDEQIIIELEKIPKEYDRLVFVVNIYQAVQRRQHFGMIRNAYIRLLDAKTNQEMCRYDLTDNYNGKTAMIFGEVYYKNGEWKFNAIGQGTEDADLGLLAGRFQ